MVILDLQIAFIQCVQFFRDLSRSSSYITMKYLLERWPSFIIKRLHLKLMQKDKTALTNVSKPAEDTEAVLCDPETKTHVKSEPATNLGGP